MYIKCIAILVSNCFGSEIVDERNFEIAEENKALEFFNKYSDDKYRCVKFYFKKEIAT